jgi:EAL domain-containing protein (putative c-di-GMP-specific phosphodiesterase class I)
VSVNLSARQLHLPGLPNVVAQVLSDTALDPACLILEITESQLLHDTDVMISRLRDLKKLGLRLALDDFGTGYSSLGHLRRFPIDMIKIDKSFVAEMMTGHEQAALARAVVQLGRTLRLTVVAEGIETAEQLGQLREAGCQLGQGHLFAAALGPAELASLAAGPSPERAY